MEIVENTDSSLICELGIEIDDQNCDTGVDPRSKEKLKKYNRKWKLMREFALVTAATLSDEFSHLESSEARILYSCDSHAGQGLAGLQWKKHLSDKIHVTLSDHHSVYKIKENAERNSLRTVTFCLDPTRTPGDPRKQQKSDEVFLCQADASVLFNTEAFKFIYLCPVKNVSSYFESVFKSLSSKGVICAVVPDASTFGRTPHVIRRNYAADVIKTEYLKEFAARVIIASMARAAGRHGKGIKPLYVVHLDDVLLVCVKATKGNKEIDESLSQVCRLLHCRVCEERTFVSNQLAPEENPYQYLKCSCKKEKLGKTAVFIGPAWSGFIFQADFLQKISIKAKDFSMSQKFLEILNLLQSESQCLSRRLNSLGTVQTEINKTTIIENNKCSEVNERKNCNDEKRADQSDEIDDENMRKSIPGKRKAEVESSDNVKRPKLTTICDEPCNVQFYYNVNKSKKTKLPKLDQFVSVLHNHGHRACRTHFDYNAIRTSASVKQFLELL